MCSVTGTWDLASYLILDAEVLDRCRHLADLGTRTVLDMSTRYEDTWLPLLLWILARPLGK